MLALSENQHRTKRWLGLKVQQQALKGPQSLWDFKKIAASFKIVRE